MKKIIGIFAFTLLFAISSNAQPKGKEERIKSLRIAFITSKLDMTPEESQAFWPLHNNMEKELRQLRKDFKPPKNVADLTDAEIETLMLQRFDMEEQKLAIKRKYFEQFKVVLPIRKIAKLQMLEKEFKRQLVERLGEEKHRRRGSQR